ncbi:MAG: 50S ribosomal protein L34e [Candidatus Micrarchaeia archaeon]|jgi:large subunit ribosomal protein L34e
MAPAPRFRQAIKRQRKSPGGKPTVKYKAKKPAKVLCALCGAKLNAVPNKSVAKLRKLSKTEKRPERAFGGVLCANCTQQLIKEKLRINAGTVSKSDVDFRHHKYIDAIKLG